MSKEQTPDNSTTATIIKMLWPVEPHENKKFIPMALMMFCILFNYAMLRSIKDGFVVTSIGAEAISFLKTYGVLPSAVLSMIIYSKLVNSLSQQKVFYTIASFFIAFIALFAFVIYPNPEYFHPSKDSVEALVEQAPNFQWFIRIGGNWSYAAFYILSELWGSMLLSLLFWQFANQITKTTEAKRFYSHFGLIANTSLLLVSFVLTTFLGNEVADNISELKIASGDTLKFIPVFMTTIASGLIVIFLYAWINKYVLTDPNLYDPNASGKKKNKTKLGLKDSFKMIVTSKYLLYLVTLVIVYGVSVNLVEGPWKAALREMYPSKEEYTLFMGNFQFYQGLAAIFFMLIGSNILRRVSWFTAALFTPVMMLVTGAAFFSFIIFKSTLGLSLAAFFGTGPVLLAVIFGSAQNVLSKATKYSLFDSTKEMAYIPLDDELKTKGKAAVDVIGARLGKSGGGLIQSTFFLLLPSYTFAEATPYFAAIFFGIVILWALAVLGLSKEYYAKLAENEEQ